MLAPSLLAAYHASLYRLHLPTQDCVVQIGARSLVLDDFLQQQHCQHACFISAHNPHSHRLPAALNHSRNAALVQILLARRLLCFPGLGYSADPHSDWPAEAGFLVLHTEAALAQSLAAVFGQNAVLLLQPEQPVALLLTAGSRATAESSRQ